jgi:hypothetical protein
MRKLIEEIIQEYDDNDDADVIEVPFGTLDQLKEAIN